MKRSKVLQSKKDRVKKARRRARAQIGIVPPSRPFVPKSRKPPRHKTPPDADLD